MSSYASSVMFHSPTSLLDFIKLRNYIYIYVKIYFKYTKEGFNCRLECA